MRVPGVLGTIFLAAAAVCGLLAAALAWRGLWWLALWPAASAAFAVYLQQTVIP